MLWPDTVLRDWWVAGDWRQLAPALDQVARQSVRRWGLDPDDLDDVAQHTVVKCWARSEVPNTPQGFARSTARNRWKHDHRSHAVARRASLDLVVNVPDLRQDPVAYAAMRERYHQLMAHVPRQHRDVFLMLYLCGYSYAEISRRVRVPVPALKMRILRVRAQIPDTVDAL